MLPEAIHTEIERELDTNIVDQVSVTGGDINSGACLDTNPASAFLLNGISMLPMICS